MVLQGWICSKISQQSTYFFQKKSGKSFVGGCWDFWPKQHVHVQTPAYGFEPLPYTNVLAGICHVCVDTKAILLPTGKAASTQAKVWSCSKPGSQKGTSSCRPPSQAGSTLPDHWKWLGTGLLPMSLPSLFPWNIYMSWKQEPKFRTCTQRIIPSFQPSLGACLQNPFTSHPSYFEDLSQRD